jgi:hypothetical protein
MAPALDDFSQPGIGTALLDRIDPHRHTLADQALAARATHSSEPVASRISSGSSPDASAST